MALGCDIGKVYDIVTRQFALNIQVPVITGSVPEMSIEKHWGQLRVVCNRCRRCRVWHDSWYEFSADCPPKCIVDGLEWEVVIVLFEWWVAASVTEQIAEHAVVDDPKCCTNRRLS